MIERDFLKRVYRASVAMTLIIGVYGAVYVDGQWALAFTLAAAWSIVNLWAWERLGVQLEPILSIYSQKGSRRALVGFFCLKVPILYGLILLYLITIPLRPIAVIGGVFVPYGVITLKAAGHALAQAMGWEKASGAATAEKHQDEAQNR